MIKYLGSKRSLIPDILGVVADLPQVTSVIDLFSGTSRVGHALKGQGYKVIANDYSTYAATIARCYIQTDVEEVMEDATKLVREFNALPGFHGYFTETFCVKSRFFQPKNGIKVDAIREAIAHKCLPPELEAVMLVSLMEAADRVDSTTGVQMAYLKNWAPRSHNDLELRVPNVLPRATHGKGLAMCMDALDAAKSFHADLAYIDPPYNQHSYLGNYHIWESLVRWDKPETYGVACKRVDVRSRQSLYNSKPKSKSALAALLQTVTAPNIVVSFNDEGYLLKTEIESLLSEMWGGTAKVSTHIKDYKRYVGAQIGIHSPQGEKVGRVSHLKNHEYLFVATKPH